MFGTIVNAITISIGSIIGILFHKKINQDIATSLFKVVGLTVIYLGISGLMVVEDSMIIILSMALGTLLGEVLNIEKKLEHFSGKVETFVNQYYTGKIKDGFLTASLLFCIGSMAILGPIESTLSNNHATLYAKSILDGITSVIFASSMGLGVMFSAFSVLAYQGTISLLASGIRPLVVAIPETIPMISGVGSLMIMGLGINMVFNLKLKITNMLPSILVPILYALGLLLWQKIF